MFRHDEHSEVLAFTAQQIPGIADRRYPSALAGDLYPHGIPIHPEDRLEELIHELQMDQCVMAYSDVSHVDVMHLASRANAAGADFQLVAPARTMLTARLPVVAVCASRTGAGKSQTSRAIARRLRHDGIRVAVLRHPMPYGDLWRQRVQRFANAEDMDRHQVTIEEREEYEPHLAAGSVVYAGVDYEAILAEAQNDADVLVWDGGNNDTSFLRADLIRDLEATIEAASASGVEAVAIGTPIDLEKLIRISIPTTRVRYELRIPEPSSLDEVLAPILALRGRNATS